MSEALKALIDTFAGKRILVIGDIVLDQYVHGAIERVNPEAGAPLLHAQEENAMTGGAGNVAKNIAQLGARASLISVVGDDDFGSVVAQHAKQENYETHLLRDPSRPTIRKIRFYRGMEQLLRVDYEDTHNIDEAMEQQVITEIQRYITSGADAVVVSDYAKGVITKTVAEAIVQACKDQEILLAVDAKPSRAEYFVGAGLISPNIKEAKQFLGLDEQAQLPYADIAAKLAQQMHSEAYVTLGAEGVYYYRSADDHGLVKQEHVVQVYDVSGAGDTAISVLTLARLAGASPQEAAQLANAAGAVVVSKVGSVGLSSQELSDMILHHHDHGE
jgi:rfaE bifunctional protein kinase chain/domain